MTLPNLRRLSIADLDEPTLRRLVNHGEDLLVERKQSPPPAPRFGAEVASFANTLGGWILIGVADDKSLVGWAPPQGTDLQSHLGNLLRNELDPVPPFLAEPTSLDGTDLAIVRVFEADDTPVIVRGTGAVYVRDSGGKQPVDDHRTLLELARRGERARAEAETRLRSLPIVAQALRPPDTPIGVEPDEFTDETHLRVIVRAAPLTVTPSFADWALSRAPEALHQSAMGMLPSTGIHDHGLAEIEPQGRGVVVRRVSGYPSRTYLTIVADAGGVIAASVARTQVGSDMTATDIINVAFVRPLIDLVADLLREAEALGSAAWDVWILLPDGLDLHQAERMPPPLLRMGSEMTIPADASERTALAARWERELRREAGIAASWENAS